MKEQNFEQPMQSPDQYAGEQEKNQTPILAHFSQKELDYLDELQGGPEDALGIGLRSYFALADRFKNDKELRDRLEGSYKAALTAPGNEELDESVQSIDQIRQRFDPQPAFKDSPSEHQPPIEQLAKEGEHGDDEIAVIPLGFSKYLDELIGGPFINPKSGLKEYWLFASLMPLLGAIGGKAVAAKMALSTLGTALASGLGSAFGSALSGSGWKGIGKSALFGTAGSYALDKLGSLAGAASSTGASMFGRPEVTAGSMWGGGAGPIMQAGQQFLQQPAQEGIIKGLMNKVTESPNLLPLAGLGGLFAKGHNAEQKQAKNILAQQRKNEEIERQEREALNRHYGIGEKTTPNVQLRSFLNKAFRPLISAKKGGRIRRAEGGEIDISPYMERLSPEERYRNEIYNIQYQLNKAKYDALQHKLDPFRNSGVGHLVDKYYDEISRNNGYLNMDGYGNNRGDIESPHIIGPVMDLYHTVQDQSYLDPLYNKFKKSIFDKYGVEDNTPSNVPSLGTKPFDPVNNAPPLMNDGRIRQPKTPFIPTSSNEESGPPKLRDFRNKRAKGGAMKNIHEWVRNNPKEPAEVRYISGKGKGQADLVMDDNVRDGAYIIDATTVAHTGDGSSKAGFMEWSKLAKFKKNHKYSGGPISPEIVPAALSDGEIELNPALVTAIGEGSNKRGASILKKTVKLIRKDKATNGLGLPPKAKPLVQYINKARGING
jgi:hypothetical protein